VFGALALAAATLGRTARRHRWRPWRWIGLHLTGMSASYILLLTAFYVDNGKHLPIWRALPHLAYWLLPSAIGLPWSLVPWAATAASHRIGPPTPRPLRRRPSTSAAASGSCTSLRVAGSRRLDGRRLLARRCPLPVLLVVGVAVGVSFCAALDRCQPAATDRAAGRADQPPVTGEATCRGGIGAGHPGLSAEPDGPAAGDGASRKLAAILA
jgi:hypothetical protein